MQWALLQQYFLSNLQEIVRNIILRGGVNSAVAPRSVNAASRTRYPNGSAARVIDPISPLAVTGGFSGI